MGEGKGTDVPEIYVPEVEVGFHRADLRRDHLFLPNGYRIGDSIAVYLLQAWVEAAFGDKKTSLLANENSWLPMWWQLSRRTPAIIKHAPGLKVPAL